MHGFVNVFVAAAFAWQGAERGVMLEVLNDGDAGRFPVLEWRVALARAEHRGRRNRIRAPRFRAQLRIVFVHGAGGGFEDVGVASIGVVGHFKPHAG